MKKVVVATPPDTAGGFGLAGVRQLVIHEQEPRTMVLALAADPAIGVLVVDERLIDRPLQERLDEVAERWPGLVVVLPAPEAAPRPEEDYALRLIRRAIGYQVRLNL